MLVRLSAYVLTGEHIGILVELYHRFARYGLVDDAFLICVQGFYLLTLQGDEGVYLGTLGVEVGGDALLVGERGDRQPKLTERVLAYVWLSSAYSSIYQISLR